MSTDQDVDIQLVARAQAGDQRAFELLVRKYQHKIIQLVSRL
ncbi:MAG: RNA polymerase sigma factor RpoE, partial [Pseudomonadota bacterium]